MPERRSYNPIWVQTLPIAHRGLHGPGAPENSLAAFAAAATAGYAIELDVHLLNGQLVVAHDAPDAKTAAALPTLTEVLKIVAGRVPIDIEIKWPSTIAELGPVLLALLENHPGEIVVTSFDPRILIWLKRHAPQLPRGQLASSLPNKPRWPRILRFLLRSMPLNLLARPQFIVYDQRDYPSRTLSFWQHHLKIPVVLGTITTEQQLATARRYGCNVIFDHIRP